MRLLLALVLLPALAFATPECGNMKYGPLPKGLPDRLITPMHENWEIRFVTVFFDDPELIGLTCPMDHTINIKTGLSNWMTRIALMHEILHVSFRGTADYRETAPPEFSEEIFINSMGYRLTAIMEKNPKVFQFIANDKGD